jgi:CBS domain-containing protein
MNVSEIMSSEFAVIPCNLTLRDAARRMRELNVGVLPATDQGQLVGMLTDRDIATRAVAGGSDPERTRVEDVMTPTVVECSIHDSIEAAVAKMEAAQVRRLVVVGDTHEIVGIVSVDDLAHRLPVDHPAADVLRQLPEAGPEHP